jgi:hypothetical protein
MITKLIQFVGDKQVPANFGLGLIAAYALVYLGMAVRILQSVPQYELTTTGIDGFIWVHELSIPHPS